MRIYKLSQCWGRLVVPTKPCIGFFILLNSLGIEDFNRLQLLATDVITVVY